MKLLFDADGFRYPLTGIGHYINELSKHLSKIKELETIYFYQKLKFKMALSVHSPTKKNSQLLNIKLLDNIITRSIYYKISSQYVRFKTKNLNLNVYHAPNFILKKLSIPSVATIHDFSIKHYPDFHPKARLRYFNKYLSDTIHRATHLITDSNFIKNELIEFYPTCKDKVTAIHLGVNKSFQPRSEEITKPYLAQYGLRYRGYILSVATIEPRKNIARLIQAYATLPFTCQREFPLVLVGHSGWQSDELHALINQLQQQKTLYYLNYLRQEALFAIYASARCFVYPSLYEGFGLPILEAMASGAPVVSSTASSLVEVAANAAHLVDPYDIESIANGIYTFCQNDSKWEHYRQLGIQNAAQFTWEKCAAKTFQVYRAINK